MTPCQSKQNKDCAGNARDHIHSWRVVQNLQPVASEALGSWRVCRGGRMCAVYFGKRIKAQWVYLISSLCLLGNPTAKNRANSGRAERLTRLHITGRCKVLRTGNSKARGDTQRPLAREIRCPGHCRNLLEEKRHERFLHGVRRSVTPRGDPQSYSDLV